MKRSARPTEKTKKATSGKSEKEIIAHRRACDPKGIGLSHYVFSEKKSR